MPSVTEVLDYLTEPELLNWKLNNSKAKVKAISDEALRVGNAVDLLVQQDIRDGGYLVPEGDTPIENCMRAWELFKKDYPLFVPSVLEMQTELTSEDLIGHPDFIHSNGITDLKCSKSIWPRHWTQTAKYFDLKFDNTSAAWSKGFIAVVRLDKKLGVYEYVKIEDQAYIAYEISVFDAYLLAYYHNVRNREMIRQQLEKELLDVS